MGVRAAGLRQSKGSLGGLGAKGREAAVAATLIVLRRGELARDIRDGIGGARAAVRPAVPQVYFVKVMASTTTSRFAGRVRLFSLLAGFSLK